MKNAKRLIIIIAVAFVTFAAFACSSNSVSDQDMCKSYNRACRVIYERYYEQGQYFLYTKKYVDVQHRNWSEKQEVYYAYEDLYILGDDYYPNNILMAECNEITADSYIDAQGHYYYITSEEYRHLHPTVQRKYIELHQPYE